ncbi:MAG: hypothetical protein MJ252_30090, partial [archaeon]|nr:hypothetical protein [archaeon]
MDKKITKDSTAKDTATKPTTEVKKDNPVEATKEQPKDATKNKDQTATKKDDKKTNEKKETKKTAEKKTVKPNPKASAKAPTRSIGKRGQTKKETKLPEKKLYLNFGKKIINNKGEEQDLDEESFLKVPVIGVLFTGSWCPPAREFMPKLEEVYQEANKKAKEEGKSFEIIQISSEKTEADFKNNMTETRNWLYVPFNDPYMSKLKEDYKVEYIPKLVIVDRTLYRLSENGRKDIVELGTKAYEIWRDKYRARRKREEERLNQEENEDDE